MRPTSGWRTTSVSSSRTTPTSSIPMKSRSTSPIPLRMPRGKSICVSSAVTTILELAPSRVRNILSCSCVAFCASSRITNASESVRPRMYASGATSIVPRSRYFSVAPFSSSSCSASYSGRRYGSTFSLKSPGRKPSFSPASTAGRDSTIRDTSRFLSARTAMTIARNVLPVPAGPIANDSVLAAIAATSAR